MYTFRTSLLSRLFIFGSIFIGAWQAGTANPTGGAVVSGSATIQGGAGTTTINQTSRGAIINWQTFSINVGESTHFIQPNAQSAALNRVLGGSASQINGTLSANGQVYLINQNGILVGPSGVVNAAGGFTGSTRDISDSDFLNGNLHFMGHSHAGVRNLGQIKSELGNVTLVGQTVENRGSIHASHGTAGLVAGDDVLLGQKNADGSTITVNASPLAKRASSKTGVLNRGKISSAAAELKAANGNIYALAINNSGVVRSTNVNKQGGHIWLTADSGSIVNSGTLTANATAPGGHGGNIVLKSTAGMVNDPGSIIAEGGLGGTGGNVDVSAPKLKFGGTVNLSAPGGKKGSLLLDPTTLQVVVGGSGYISGGMNDSSDSTIDPNTVDAALASANVTLNADYNITITDGITWNSNSVLTLTTNYSGSTIAINSPINGLAGTLAIQTAGSNDYIIPSSLGSIAVNNFILSNGYWYQLGSLAAFNAAFDFEVNGGTFLRAAGGDGSQGNPFQITDVYGLQGIGSPSNNINGDNYVQINDIDATGTGTWNGYYAFVPINLTGSYEGAGHSINNLVVSVTVNNVGLFASTASSSVVSDVNLTNASMFGNSQNGTLVGTNNGLVQNCTATGTVVSQANCLQIGGLVGYNSPSGVVSGCSTTTIVQAGVNSTQVGGIVGGSDGTIFSCASSANVSSAGGSSNAYGGIAGYSGSGGVSGCSFSGSVFVGGGPGFVAGVVGINYGNVSDCSSTGTISGPTLTGGVVGLNFGAVNGCYSTGNIYGESGSEIGGLVGENDGTISTSYSLAAVNGGSSSTEVGGLVGLNYGHILTCYSAGSVTGGSAVGGFAGADSSGTINDCYYATDASGQSVGVFAQSGTTINYLGVPTTDVTGFTFGQLSRSKNFDAAWDFAPATGTFGINAVSDTGLINGGLPFLQSQYIVVASYAPISQTTIYNQTTTGTGFLSNGYVANIPTEFQSLPLSGTPTVVAIGNNANVGTTPLSVIQPAPTIDGYAVESLSGGFETITPKPIIVSAVSGITSTYGTAPSFANDNGGAQVISGDVLGGVTGYTYSDLPSPGGYLNSGSYVYAPIISGYNSNYTIVGYNPGVFTVTPAILSYVANGANGAVGQPFPAFSGSVAGFLPGDTLGNATTGTASFGTTATSNSSSGLYAINGGGLTSGNYVFVQAPSNAGAFNLQQAGTVLPLPIPLIGNVTPNTSISTLIGSGTNPVLVSSQVASGSVGSSFNAQSGSGGGGFLGSHSGGQGGGGFGSGDNSSGSGDNDGGGGGLSGSSSVSGVVGGDSDGDGGGDNGGGRGGRGERGDGRGGRRGDKRGDDDTAGGRGGNGRVVDQNGRPAAGFYTRGGFSGFNRGPVPAFVQNRLSTGLTRNVRDALYDANKFSALAKADREHAESLRNGAGPGGHAVIGTVIDQRGQAARGFYATPGGFFGFGGANMPPLIQDHINHVLTGDVRDELLNATK